MNLESPALPFDERVDMLFRELQLAHRFHRPSILLAIYQSAFVLAEAQAALTKLLVEGETSAQDNPPPLTVFHYTVTGPDTADVPHALAEHPAHEKVVFFVTGLQWGGGDDGLNAYRALNYRREYLVEHRLRVVFWLTEKEAVALPLHAPDFWAFRHRTVEFMDVPEPQQIGQWAEVAAWADFEDHTLREDTEGKIALREILLQDLPEAPETQTARLTLLYTLAGLYSAKGDFENSLTHAHQALHLAKDLNNQYLLAQCYLGLGNVYDKAGRHDQALSAYQQAIALDSKSAAPHNGLGNVYRALGHYEGALAAYQRAITLDPKLAYSHNGLGNVYRALGHYEDALAAYQRAITLNPKLAYPRNGLGNVYANTGRYEEALVAYQQAIALEPKYAYPYNGLGNVYAKTERYEKALAAYQQAIALEPKDAYSYNGLGNVYRDTGRYEEALAAYRQAITLSHQEVVYHQNLGTTYLLLGQPEAALQAYEQAVALAPNKGSYRSSLISVLRQLGREAEAQAQIEIAWPLMAQESEYNRACFEAVCGNVEEGLALLRVALEKKQVTPEWARRDPDLEALRTDPRFAEIVGASAEP